MNQPESQPESTLVVEHLQHTHEACPRCGYMLHKCPSARCPECGFILQLQLAHSKSGRTWWWAGLFGSAITALLSIMMILNLTTKLWQFVGDPSKQMRVTRGFMSASELPNWTGIILAMTGLLYAALAAAVLLGARRQFERLPPAARIAAGLGLLLSPLMFLGILWIRIVM